MFSHTVLTDGYLLSTLYITVIWHTRQTEIQLSVMYMVNTISLPKLLLASFLKIEEFVWAIGINLGNTGLRAATHTAHRRAVV